MSDLTRGYNVPGVYVRDATGPLVTNAAVPDAVVTLVGPALGFQTSTDTLRISDTPQALSRRGVWYSADGAPAGVAAPVVRNAAGGVLTEGTDYVFADVFDDNEGVLTPANRITTIALGALGENSKTAGGVALGDILAVTYYYTNAAYYTPLLFDSYDAVVDTYGPALRNAASLTPGQSPILSPLSLAAALAFVNNATRLICVATDPTPVMTSVDDDNNPATPNVMQPVVPTFDAQLRAAYLKTLGDYRVGTIVPILADGGDGSLSTFQQYAMDLKAHVMSSVANGFQRVGVIGGQANAVGTVANQPPPFEEVAEAVSALPGGARVIEAYPNRLGYYNPNTGRSIEVDGYYLAAGIGAVLESNPVNQSLTRQQIVGFTGVPASITRLNTKPFKDNLSSRGVCVAEVDRQNRLIIRHGVSTDMTNVITREVSITRCRDALFDALQIGLDNSGLIGSPIDIEMTTRLKGAVSGILEGLVRDEVIISYTSLQVRQQAVLDGGDPTVIEVRFAYQPTLPLNYIVVTFSLDLTTGTFDIGDQSTTGV